MNGTTTTLFPPSCQIFLILFDTAWVFFDARLTFSDLLEKSEEINRRYFSPDKHFRHISPSEPSLHWEGNLEAFPGKGDHWWRSEVRNGSSSGAIPRFVCSRRWLWWVWRHPVDSPHCGAAAGPPSWPDPPGRPPYCGTQLAAPSPPTGTAEGHNSTGDLLHFL